MCFNHKILFYCRYPDPHLSNNSGRSVIYVEWIACLYAFGQVMLPPQKCGSNHPRNKRLLEKVGKLIQLMELTLICDFIKNKMTKSWLRQKFWAINNFSPSKERLCDTYTFCVYSVPPNRSRNWWESSFISEWQMILEF